MREQFRSITINFAPVKVVGIPGLMLVLIAIALALQFPAARWLLLAGFGGGLLIAVVLIVHRRRSAARGGGDPGHGILMACELPSTRQGGSSSRRRSGSAQVCQPALKWT
jgi:hypothetical protein